MLTLSKPLYQVLFFAILLSGLTACSASPALKVGLLFPEVESERYKVEEAMLARLLDEKGYEVLRQQANGDARLQADQLENMLKEEVRAIILVPVDGDGLVKAVDAAIAANVKVIAYDRLVKSAKLSAYISFDNRQAGRLQAQALLNALDIDNRPATRRQVRLVRITGMPADHNVRLYRLGQDEVFAPYEASRQIRFLADESLDSREQISAQRLLEKILEEENRLDGILVSNEIIGLGVLDALQAAELQDVVIVTGQESTVRVSSQVAGGQLTMSVFRDARDLPPLTVRVLDRLLKEQPLLDLQRCALADLTGDPALDGTIFCALLPVQTLTQENLFDLAVRSGYQSYDDVYREIPESLRPVRP
ncbi:MAG: substrate-binding domain-containing protein [Anaerolineales bacterium]|jgi:D-xylose transport system substrate-binding protein|nr:substrate-binding domain-containing protein [Anaerolineales bacterium]